MTHIMSCRGGGRAAWSKTTWKPTMIDEIDTTGWASKDAQHGYNLDTMRVDTNSHIELLYWSNHMYMLDPW